MKWSDIPDAEIERRRKASVSALAEKDRADFSEWYQEHCDRLYWQGGQCCAGCDYWHSDMGGSGECHASGIVPSKDVLASAGMEFCSYTPPPGFPLTHEDFVCGKFKDDFDWSSLDSAYLHQIGAMARGKLKEKPHAPRL